MAYSGLGSLQGQVESTLSPGIVCGIIEYTVDVASRSNFSALSAALELQQRNAGFNPALNASELRLVALYSQQEAAICMLKQQPEAPEAHQWWAAALSANSQLLQLDPSAAACLHCKWGRLMGISNRRTEAVAAYRLALREAPEHKCE
jgi:hypothetical protein